MSLLLYNCTLVTPAKNDLYVLKNAYIGIEGEYIDYTGDKMPEKAYDLKKDMHGNIVMPGLYNCHTHSPMVLLRGVGSDLPLDQWLCNKVFPIEDKLTAEDIRFGSYLAAMEMIASGTVSFSDMYFEPAETVNVVGEAGMKANITRPVQSFDPDENPKDSYRIAQSKELYNNFNGAFDGCVLIDFCVHAEYTCSEKIVRAYSEICKQYNGNMHIHLSETQNEHNACIEKYNKTPAEWFNSLGAFDSNAFAAHCVTLSKSDIALLKEKNVSIVHNPTSNMKLGSGFAQVPQFIAEGINVAIGTDGAASNNNLNILEEMHLASVIHNGYLNNPTVMTPFDIISMATVNGALLQRRKNCGKIEPGYKADIIALDVNKPNMQPMLDVPALIVYSAGQENVVFNMCNGKILYENGEYKTLDAEKIYYGVNKAIKHLYN